LVGLDGEEEPHAPVSILGLPILIAFADPEGVIQQTLTHAPRACRKSAPDSNLTDEPAKGVNWRVGAQKGRLVSETGIVPISEGNLILTNNRFCFHGHPKTFAIAIKQVIAFETGTTMVTIAESGKENLRVFQLKNPNGPVVEAVFKRLVAQQNKASSEAEN